MKDITEISLIVVAERILFEKKEPINIYDLFDLVAKEKKLSDPQKAIYINQFYSDLTTSAKFSYMGENKWDLKPNQKIELWDKDGSFYNEYTEVDYVDEDAPAPKKKRKTKKQKEAEKAKAEKAKLAKAEKAEKAKLAKAEKAEKAIEVDETVKVEETVEALVEDKTKVKSEVDVVEADAEIFEEEVFEDFDEDKYNEYMDTYEDRYDKKK